MTTMAQPRVEVGIGAMQDLAVAMFRQLARDVRSQGGHRREAEEFVRRSDRGMFGWACSVLGVNPEIIGPAVLRQRAER